MELGALKYITTKLTKLAFDSKNLESDLNFVIKISHSVQDNIDDSPIIIKIDGKIEGSNNDNDVAISIEAESLFETKESISEDDLNEIENKEQEYLNRPILNEMSLILGQITDKALKVPVVLPLSSMLDSSNQDYNSNEEKAD